jgi:hypothetical protein
METKSTVTDATVLAWNTIVDRYKAARKVLSEAKKQHGKKSAEAKAARKAARAIKKERAAFCAANPGFTPPPRVKKVVQKGLQRKAEDEAMREALRRRMEGETVRTFTPNTGLHLPDGTPVSAEVPLTQVTVAPVPAPVPAPVAVPAQVVAGAIARPASLSRLLLDVLDGGFVGSPKQVAERVPATAWGATITAKQAADALRRLAKEGMCIKTSAGTYAAAPVHA